MIDRALTVAEIGCNHGGNFDTAKQMIEVASQCGVDYVKFQKRDIDSIPPEVASRGRSDEHRFGDDEYSHRKALEFTIEQHHELKEIATRCGTTYACSAWDSKSYDLLVGMNCDYIKIPSARNISCTKWNISRRVPLHVSLGMTTNEERDRILRGFDHGYDLVPYACTSKYPSSPEEVYLDEVPYLALRAGRVGFSGHHKGIALDIAAYVLGATFVERHFTLDRTSKGTDHAASLEPDGLRKLVRDLEAVRLARKPKPGGLPTCETEMRKKLKY